MHSIRSNYDVYNEVDGKEISDFGSYYKEVLLHGGYVVIFFPFYYYAEWYQSFHKLGFDVMYYPYVIMYDSKSIQNRNTSVFPQESALFAMACHLPGPPKHQKFNKPFHLLNCSNRRDLSGIFNVKHEKSPLCRQRSKVVFNSNELPADMLFELVDLFYRHRGRVMDPYCGTMTKLITTIRTGRQLVGIKTSSDVFTATLHRLGGFLPSNTRPETIPGVPKEDSSIV